MLLAIASLNRNGYVREKALSYLVETKSEFAIPYIVYRLADWVPIIRNNAHIGIQNLKKKEFINALLENLVIFEQLQKIERVDLASIHTDLMYFLLVENKEYILSNFKNFTDKTRLIIGNYIAKSNSASEKELEILISDKHFLVRLQALNNFDLLTQADINTLLMDKSSRIRLLTLRKLKDKENFAEIVYDFLCDSATAIREFARYNLRTQVTDFSIVYQENLRANKNIIGSLLGLAETKAKQYSTSIVPYLLDPKLKIRKVAFLSLQKLDNDLAYQYAFQNLDSEYIGIRNICIDFLSNKANDTTMAKARSIYLQGNYELQLSMLNFFNKVGQWEAIGDIILGTISENENIRLLSYRYLEQWKSKTNTYFMQPKQEQLERVNQIFENAIIVHNEKKYFQENPLVGLDFYFK